MKTRHAWCNALVVVSCLTTGGGASAQQWPARPITVVSPFGPGTTSDIIARTVLDPVGSQLGQSFGLINRPGGSGSVGVVSVVNAVADGYTFLISTSAMSAAVILHRSLPYDVNHDLMPVAMFGGEPSILMAAPGKGFVKVADLVAAASATPTGIKFASVGVGTPSHLAGERFRLLAGLNAKHVTYLGAKEALADLAAGRVDFYFVPVTPALPLITQGKAVPLAVSTPTRLQSLSGLPTLTESGYPIPPYLTWSGLSAPKNTPRDIVDRLNSAINKTLELPPVRSKMLRTGYLPVAMTQEQFAKFFADDIDSMIKLGKDAHIEPLD